jgi:hypothetical protein
MLKRKKDKITGKCKHNHSKLYLDLPRFSAKLKIIVNTLESICPDSSISNTENEVWRHLIPCVRLLT